MMELNECSQIQGNVVHVIWCNVIQCVVMSCNVISCNVVPVVPHKAVAEVSKPVNLSER